MATLVANMSKEELRQMIGAVMEEKLVELIGDPDEGLAIRDTLRQRLQRQKKAVSQGLRGEPLDDVAERLELE